MKRIGLLIITLSLIAVVAVKFSDKPQCQYTVELKSGEIVQAVWVNHYGSGWSSIRKCDGKDIIIHTSDIKSY